MNKLKLLGIDIHGTVEYSEEPPFWDHSHLHRLNCRAISLGLAPIFDFVVPPKEDNGEVFMSKYFEEQEMRNSTVGQDKDTKLCNCRHCQAYVPSDQSEPMLPEEEATNAFIPREQQHEQEQQQDLTQRIDESVVNSGSIKPRLALLAPPFHSAFFGMAPSNCCFM